MRLFFAAVVGCVISIFAAPIIRRIAEKTRAIDRARGKPLFGGAAILVAVTGSLIVATALGWFPAGYVSARALLGLTAGGLILMLGGILDDRYDLPPSRQIIFPVLAAAIVVACGISVSYVKNPFGGIISFDPTVGRALTFFWLLGLMYTTKVLDGLDGLVASLGVIATTIMIAVALRPELAQPGPALLGAVIDGALIGFLVWNLPPARLFLGEGGSTYVGYLLGVLAVIAGSKVATTLLVLAVPIFDLGWVIARRVFVERRSPARGDRKHLHFRLLDAGFSPRGALIFFCALALLFGLVGLLAGTAAKLIVLAALLIVGLYAATVVTRREKI